MTDNDFLEVVLREHPNEWVSQREILNSSEQRRRCGMTVHSRVSDLRRRGHVIENRCERVGARVVSYYRLVEPSLTAPPVSESAATRAGIGGAVSEDALARPDNREPEDTSTEPEGPSLTSRRGSARRLPSLPATATPALFEKSPTERRPAWA
jgi:hypothetical protein